MKYYIAYGSNLSVNQMAHRCPKARIVGKAILDDWKLVFKLHATIEPAIGHHVPVLVWAINDSDERSLDRYEGFPKYYVKRELPVSVRPIKGGNAIDLTAMVYIMTDIHDIMPPTFSYYNVILEGYTRFGFDKAILREAYTDAFMHNPPAAVENGW